MNRFRAAAFFAAILFSLSVVAQVIEKPNQAMKSPETLTLNKIETVKGKSVFYFTLESKIANGYFCLDKNTYIIYPDGSKERLLKASGIPECPDNYNFKNAGDKLDFSLSFPALRKDAQWVDLVEDCSSGCMFLYGITLNRQLNSDLDKAFSESEKSTPENSVRIFSNILESIDSKNLGIEGLLYLNIINASLEAGDKVGAEVWYKRLGASGAPRLNFYLKYLNDKGIKF